MKISEVISKDLGLDKNYIEKIALISNTKYSRYYIEKKRGGKRQIHHPAPELKVLQYWAVENIFKHCKVSTHTAAYENGCSIKKNAEIHKNSKFFLTMDFSKFFETIKERHFLSVLKENQRNIPYDLKENDKTLLKKICLYDSHLVIGSVCAPRISNCVMYNFDNELMNLLNDLGIFNYSRYADDLTISSDSYISPKIVNKIRILASKHGFNINDEKTNFSSPKNRRRVTGLIIDNGKVTIGLQKRKNIKKKLYKYLEYGQGSREEILGLLYFLKDIEPDYFNKLIIKYSKYGNILNILRNKKTTAKNDI